MTQIFLELLSGERSKIEGSSRKEGRKGMIECESVAHDMHLPHDSSTGKASGKRMHYPVTIVKNRDRSTPRLYQALITGEKLAEAKLTYYATTPQGEEEAFFVKTLKGATIVDIKSRSTREASTERLSVAYEDIDWTHVRGGTATADSWKSR